MGNQLNSLPLATRFHVINGDWWGRIAGTPDAKTVFVEYTGETFPLDPKIHLEIEFEWDDDEEEDEC